MRLAVIGAGYVGLVTAACLARLGHDVTCIDLDLTRIERLSRGDVPLAEPQLDRLIIDELAAGRLVFASSPEAARGSRLALVAVGTLGPNSGEWSVDNVRSAVLAIAADSAAPREIAIRSTLLPGTARRLAAEVARFPDVEIAVNPEFTREGSAVRDFFEPDRIVIGTAQVDGPLATDLRRMYEPLAAPVMVTDLTSAETIKVASNVFLAAKVTFANELARICEATGADVQDVVDGMGMDSRIGRAFLTPGPGVGGSCLPNQTRALPVLAGQLSAKVPLIDAIAASGDRHLDWLLDLAAEAIPGGLSAARVGILGATFKAGTDDVRESPALRFAAALAARGATIALHDPASTAAGVAWLAAHGIDAMGASAPIQAATGADLVAVTTEWPIFRELDWSALAGVMRGNAILDARGTVPRDAVAASGLRVVGIRQRPVPLMPVAAADVHLGRASHHPGSAGQLLQNGGPRANALTTS